MQAEYWDTQEAAWRIFSKDSSTLMPTKNIKWLIGVYG
jgi:hypothetical protein